MTFYTYQQNNSGGSFYGWRYLVIEADDPRDADYIAERHGVYFNGVAAGRDCECCGDRWYRSFDSFDSAPFPHYYGDPLTILPGVQVGEADPAEYHLIVFRDGTEMVGRP